MKVGLQFPVEQLSGRDGLPGGLVYFRNGTLQCARRFVEPANPDTTYQDYVRNIFTLAAQNFKTLTDAQRATFAVFAAANPVSILGRDYTLQDMAAYVQSDFFSWMKAAAHLTAAPAARAGFIASALANVAYNSGTNDLTFDVTHNGTATEGYWFVRCTDTLASAQRNARQNDFRRASVIAAENIPDVAATPQTVTVTTARFAWSDQDWMEIELTPISEDFGAAAPLTFKQQITVT